LPIVHGARGVPYHAYSAGELAELHARVRVVASPRNPEQDALIAKYCILAKKGGNQVGRKHPDRIRFRYRSDVGAVRPRWDEPEDEIQTAYLALVEALTPSAGRKAYTELPGVHFSVPLKKRIEGAINDLIRHDCQGVLTEITCEPCAGSACPMCLGTGKRAHRQRLEIDEPTPESPEAEEDDERLNLSWNQPGREPDPERLLLSRERSERTKTAISLLGRGVQKLRHEYATVILGLFYNDETQDQIAEKLGVHRSSVSRYKDDALACLRFVVEPYRDGRSLGYSPSSSPPRQTGGAFSLGVAQACGCFIAISASFPVLIDALDNDIQARARWLRTQMGYRVVGDLASGIAIRKAIFHLPPTRFDNHTTPWISWESFSVWTEWPEAVGIKQDTAMCWGRWCSSEASLVQMHCRMRRLQRQSQKCPLEAEGGEWPTRDWKRNNAEKWAKTGSTGPKLYDLTSETATADVRYPKNCTYPLKGRKAGEHCGQKARIEGYCCAHWNLMEAGRIPIPMDEAELSPPGLSNSLH